MTELAPKPPFSPPFPGVAKAPETHIGPKPILAPPPPSTIDPIEAAAAARADVIGKGTTTLLVGEPGSGKTTSLVTMAEAGIETSVIITDPGGEESILDTIDRRKLSLHIHTRYIAPANPSWDQLRDMFTKINAMSYESLSSIKAGIGKEGFRQLLIFLDACANFKCATCGKVLGPVDEWDATRCLAVDSATGLNLMALSLMIGSKPTAHMGEYGVGMNAEEQMIMKLVAGTSCFFILTAHLDRVMDETLGRVQLMAAFLGSKLAPKIPRIFSDVVLAVKEGDKFSWSTTAINVALKNRALPLRDKLDPSFKPIVETWKRRQEQLKAAAITQQPNSTTKGT